MHYLWVLCFAVLFAASALIKSKWKILVLVIEGLLSLLCAIDYSVASYRGIGLVSGDFKSDSDLLTILCKNGIPCGTRFWICIVLLVTSMVFVCIKGRLEVNQKLIKAVGCFYLLSLLTMGFITTYPNETELFRGNSLVTVPSYGDESWYERDRLIMHALGAAPGGETLTNSRNALEYNYIRGARTFETDISITSDGIPVLRHDWGSDLGQAESFGWTEDNTFAPTYEQFMNTPIYGKYTPMSVLDLLLFMDNHQDVYIVTDVKFSDGPTVTDAYKAVYEVAKENNLTDVLDRLVVQIYYYDMYDEVEEIYPFKNVLLTMYVIENQPKEELCEYLLSHDMHVVTMPEYYVSNETCSYLAENGIKVYTHTVDNREDALEYYSKGVYGFYSNVFMPQNLDLLYDELQ